MDPSPVVSALSDSLPDVVITAGESTDMPSIRVEAAAIVDVMRVLRDDPRLQFALLVDLTAVDYAPATPRFEIVYHLACIGAAFTTSNSAAAPARRLRVRVPVTGDAARISTVVSIFPGANWLEREVYDLFGIIFEGHPDLRRILMPDDWQGHPLRKDYPVQVRKDTASWQPVQISVEEFADNVRAARERSTKIAGPDRR